MSFQRLINFLAVVCAALLIFIVFRAPPKSEETHGGSAAIDWTSVTPRDLNIAGVFLTARDSGVRRALDTLRLLASRDTGLQRQGHGLAHALGRFAIAQ